MTTRADIVEDVLATLSTDLGDADSRTHLTVAVGTSDVEFTVGDGKQISSGLAEVEDELVWIAAVDRPSNRFTVEPYGRGFRGTTAVSHGITSRVTSNPRFPRQRVRLVLDQVLRQVYPSIFQVKVDVATTYSPAKVAYELPSDCDTLLSLAYKSGGPSGSWAPIRAYRVDRLADTTDFPSGRSVDVLEGAQPGAALKFAYATRPGTFAADADELSTLGLDDAARDILSWGVCARLVQAEEARRIQNMTPEQAARDQLVPPGAATAASRAYYALFAQRLQEEGDRLRRLYPAVPHMTG